jgi:hypothetical protein
MSDAEKEPVKDQIIDDEEVIFANVVNLKKIETK